jgi:hypothetical protein
MPGRALKYLGFLVVAAFLTYSIISSMDTLSFFYKTKNAEWKKVYNIFKYNSEPGDIAYMLNLVKIDRYSPYFLSTNFYYNENEFRPVILNHARDIPSHLKDSKIWNQKRNIYLLCSYGWEKIKKQYFKGMKNVKLFRFVALSLIRIQVKPDSPEDFIFTLRMLKEKLPETESNYLIYQILIQIDLDNGNIEDARKNIKILELANKRKKLDRLIHRFKENLKSLQEGKK